jgi:uncharacterized repeat protein (TIGR03803 family)
MKYKRFLGAASAALMIVILITLVLAPGGWAQSKYKTLYKFTGGADGSYPPAGLIFDAAGNLYGTTAFGGAHNAGTVFELTPNADGGWTESVLYSFTGGKDGWNPEASLIFDSGGSLYGTTIGGGGGSGNGTVFKLMPNPDGSWTESVLHSFQGKDGELPDAGVIFDSGGSLYGATTGGGAFGIGTVFKLTPNPDGSWTESVLHSFQGGRDGSYPNFGSLLFDATGNLYGATTSGGKGSCTDFLSGCGTIFELTPKPDGTWTEQILHRFSGGNDGSGPEATLIFDKSGNLYGTTTFGGTHGIGNVFELMPNSEGSWTEKVLHQFKGGAWGSPGGVIFDQAGNLYGTTVTGGNLTICHGYSILGCGVVFKLAPNSNGGWNETVLHTFMDHPGAFPYGLPIFDAAGNLYGTTAGNNFKKTFGSVYEIMP